MTKYLRAEGTIFGPETDANRNAGNAASSLDDKADSNRTQKTAHSGAGLSYAQPIQGIAEHPANTRYLENGRSVLHPEVKRVLHAVDGMTTIDIERLEASIVADAKGA